MRFALKKNNGVVVDPDVAEQSKEQIKKTERLLTKSRWRETEDKRASSKKIKYDETDADEEQRYWLHLRQGESTEERKCDVTGESETHTTQMAR